MKEKNKPEMEWQGIPTHREDLMKVIKDGISEAQGPMAIIESSKDTMKEIFEAVHEKTGIPRRTFNFLVKAKYFGNGRETIAKNDELAEALDAFETKYE